MLATPYSTLPARACARAATGNAASTVPPAETAKKDRRSRRMDMATPGQVENAAERGAGLSGIGRVAGHLVDENVLLSVHGEHDRAGVRVVLVQRAGLAPDVLAGAAHAVVVVHRALEHVGLFQLRML